MNPKFLPPLFGSLFLKPRAALPGSLVSHGPVCKPAPYSTSATVTVIQRAVVRPIYTHIHTYIYIYIYNIYLPIYLSIYIHIYNMAQDLKFKGSIGSY